MPTAKITRISTVSAAAAMVILLLCTALSQQAAGESSRKTKIPQRSGNRIPVHISNGSPLTLDKINLTITPPSNWKVRFDTAKFDLVAEEPTRGRVKAGKQWVNFKRNITVKTIDQANFIDESRAAAFPDELALILKADPNAQVLNARTFNYKGKDDGITAYSTTSLNGIEVTQLHVLVGGSDRQYLLTYSDLSSRYRADSEAGKLAWTTLTRVQITGTPPWRYTRPLGFVSIALISIISLLTLRHLRRRREVQHLKLNEKIAAADFWSQNHENIVNGSFSQLSPESSFSIHRHQPNIESKGMAPTAHSHYSLAEEYSAISAVS